MEGEKHNIGIIFQFFLFWNQGCSLIFVLEGEFFSPNTFTVKILRLCHNFHNDTSSPSTKKYMLLVLIRFTETFALLFLRVQIGLLATSGHKIKEENTLFWFSVPWLSFTVPGGSGSFTEKLLWYNKNGNHNVRVELFLEFLNAINFNST